MSENTAWDFAKLYNPVFNKDFQDLQLEKFKQHGFPTRRHEDWKYTNVSAIAKQDFGRCVFQENTIDVTLHLLNNTHSIVIIDGFYSEEHSSFPSGQLTVSRIKNPVKEFEAVKANIFASMAEALLTDGVLVEIKDNVEIKLPIQILYFSTQENKQYHTKITVLVGSNSRASIFENYKSDSSGQYFNNVVTQLRLNSGAQIHYYKLQQESSNAYHISNLSVLQKADSRFVAYHFPKGAKIARDDIAINLVQKGAQCCLYGFYNLMNQSHYDCHSVISHKNSQTHSEQNYKGIIDDQGRAVFNGKVIVDQDTKAVTALQSNKNLLLSNKAEIDTKPELEIYADDVKCSHGATVGQLDEEALFFLQSRGIPKPQAIKMLTHAFAGEILKKLPEKNVVTDYISQQVMENMND